MAFKLDLIEDITNGFSEYQKVGSGGYGDVYKAVYNGKEIAVKKLHPTLGLSNTQFVNQIDDLMRISHKNVMRLIGYCNEPRRRFTFYKGEYVFGSIEERLILLEYIHGGSLDKHIADESCGLDWPTCYEIIKGTCQGLNHLHTMNIFYIDLKPANILLDNSLKPKIADLSFSRLVHTTRTHKTEMLKRTHTGYMPPEYTDYGVISKKTDVFSLGITIIKMMAGNMGYFRCPKMSPKDFIEFVSENWTGRLKAMPEHYSSQEIDILRVITCVEIALRCVENDQEKRPCTDDIVHELEELEAEIKRIMLLHPDHRQILLTNQGLGPEFPKITRLCVAHNLAPYKRILDFKLGLIEAITNGFSNDQKIGSDGYGYVYTAVYNGVEIAVKKLHSLEGLDDREFENEMHNLTKVRHKNIGRLIGYCYEPCHINIEHSDELVSTRAMERVLCFEYIQGGSLDKHIADTTGIVADAECQKHSAKGLKPSAKPLPRVVLGKGHPAYTSQANRFLPRAICRTLGKDFAKSQIQSLGKEK